MNEPTDGVRYRLESHERRISDLERKTEDVNVHKSEIANLWREIHDLGEEVGNLRRAIITAAISFAGGALLVAVTIFQVFQ